MRGLVLGGGGAKGAYQVGVLKHLYGNLGIQHEVLTGTSVGAINAAFLAHFPMGEEKKAIFELEKLWLELSTRRVRRYWYYGLLWKLPFLLPWWLGGKLSMYTSKPLRKMLLGRIEHKAIRQSGHVLRIGATNINTGGRHVWTERDSDIAMAVLASSSFPAALEPVEIDGMLYSDDGVREIVPVESAIDAGADRLDVVMCSPHNVVGQFSRHASGYELATRLIDASGVEIEKWDLKVVELYNALYEARHPAANGKGKVEMSQIRPKQALLDDSLDFDPAKIRTNIERGYRDAQDMEFV